MKNTIALSLSLFLFAHASTFCQAPLHQRHSRQWHNAIISGAFAGVAAILAYCCVKEIRLDKTSKSVVPNLTLLLTSALFTKLAYDSAVDCKETVEELV